MLERENVGMEEIQISVFNPSLCRGEIPLVVNTEYPHWSDQTHTQTEGCVDRERLTGEITERIRNQGRANAGSISISISTNQINPVTTG